MCGGGEWGPPDAVLEPGQEVPAVGGTGLECGLCDPLGLGLEVVGQALPVQAEEGVGVRAPAPEALPPVAPFAARPAPAQAAPDNNRGRYNSALLGKPSSKDREAELPVLPIDFDARLLTYLRSELRGKVRGQATTAILAGKARGWFAQFDLSEVGGRDSEAISRVIARAIAAAQSDCEEDRIIRESLVDNLHEIRKANALYGSGILGYNRHWYASVGAGLIAGCVAYCAANVLFPSLRYMVVSAPSYSELRGLYPFVDGSGRMIEGVRRVFGEQIEARCRDLVGKPIRNPFNFGFAGFAVFGAGFGSGTYFVKKFLGVEQVKISSPN